VRRDQAPLDEAVRDAREDLVVLAAAGLRLVGVDDEVVRVRVLVGLGDEAPLAAGRKERAAATAEFGGEQLVDHGARLERARLGERLVAAHGLVLGELRQVALGRASHDDRRPLGHRVTSATIAGTSPGWTFWR
jgi:hypothetical protein